MENQQIDLEVNNSQLRVNIMRSIFIGIQNITYSSQEKIKNHNHISEFLQINQTKTLFSIGKLPH